MKNLKFIPENEVVESMSELATVNPGSTDSASTSVSQITTTRSNQSDNSLSTITNNQQFIEEEEKLSSKNGHIQGNGNTEGRRSLPPLSRNSINAIETPPLAKALTVPSPSQPKKTVETPQPRRSFVLALMGGIDGSDRFHNRPSISSSERPSAGTEEQKDVMKLWLGS